MDTYNIGDGSQQIQLTVDINTIGLAGSRANAGKPGGTPVAVAHSVDVTGDIPNSNIGDAKNLKGSTLVISTLIDLKIVGDKNARKAESDRINGKYILDNGIDGHKLYDQPDKKMPNADYTTVILLKQFNLL